MSEEILNFFRLCQKAFGTVGNVLQTRLIEHRQRQFVSVRRNVRVLRIGKRARCVVHRADNVAGKRQRGVVGGSLVGEGRHVVVPLGAVNRLCAQQIGIGALPAARQSGAVEIDRKVVFCSRLQKVDTIVHIELVVAREEVDFHASNPDFFEPRELFLTVFGLVQAELRTRRAVNPTNRRTVPNQRLDIVVDGIFYSVLNGLAVFHLVPFSIDKHIRKFQTDSQIHIFFDNVVVVRAVIVGPVNPRNHARLNPRNIVKLAVGGHIGNQCRFHNISKIANNSHAPRRQVRASDFGLVLIGADVENLNVTAIVPKARRAVVGIHVRLAQKHVNIASRLNQSGIRPTTAPAVFHESARKTEHGLLLCGGVGREESLVRLAPLHKPAAGAFFYLVRS